MSATQQHHTIAWVKAYLMALGEKRPLSLIRQSRQFNLDFTSLDFTS